MSVRLVNFCWTFRRLMDINLILGLLVRRGQRQWGPRGVCCWPKHRAARRNASSLHPPSLPLHLLRRQCQLCTGFRLWKSIPATDQKWCGYWEIILTDMLWTQHSRWICSLDESYRIYRVAAMTVSAVASSAAKLQLGLIFASFTPIARMLW